MNSTEKQEAQFPLGDTTYLLNGIAMEIHRTLGNGMLEIIYKDAFEVELRTRNISYEREKEFVVNYKGTVLPHKFYADFVVMNKIIVEIKAQKGLLEDHFSQTLNYLSVSKCKVGLIFNFKGDSLVFKRLIL